MRSPWCPLNHSGSATLIASTDNGDVMAGLWLQIGVAGRKSISSSPATLVLLLATATARPLQALNPARSSNGCVNGCAVPSRLSRCNDQAPRLQTAAISCSPSQAVVLIP